MKLNQPLIADYEHFNKHFLSLFSGKMSSISFNKIILIKKKEIHYFKINK